MDKSGTVECFAQLLLIFFNSVHTVTNVLLNLFDSYRDQRRD